MPGRRSSASESARVRRAARRRGAARGPRGAGRGRPGRRSPCSARRPPSTSSRCRTLTAAGRRREEPVPGDGRRTQRGARQEALQARAAGPQGARAAARAGAADQAADPRAGGRQGQGRATTARPAASSTAPCPAYVTSPYGYRVHPIYGYYGLHDGIDFGAALRQPDVRRGRRQGARRATTRPSTATASSSTSATSTASTCRSIYNHATGYRRRRRPDRRARPGRSGTSAPPAGRPAATCTSR